MDRVQTVASWLTATAQVARTLLTRILARLAGLRSRKMVSDGLKGPKSGLLASANQLQRVRSMVDSCVKLPS